MTQSNKYQVTNTFSGGMNSDADKSVMAKNQYLYAENFRILNDSTTNSVGSLENLLGNTKLGDVITAGFYPVGFCNIRDELYLFTTQNEHPTDGLWSEILKVVFAADGESIASHVHVYQDWLSSDGSSLNLSRDHLIKAVGRYESDTIKKIYFADGYNIFRSINVANVSTTSPVNKFDVIPNFNLSQPLFSSFGTGKLTSGKIQYAYQMYDLNGPETLFSPASSLISLSTFSGQSGSNKTFKGSDYDINTGKGVRISIFPPSGFSRIRVVSIKYNTLNGMPVISIIADQNIGTSPSTTYFYDTGLSNLGSYTYEEFSIIGRGVFVASEVEEKNNYLFTANIIDKDWDVDFDARTYRFVSSTATGTLTSGHAAIFDSGSWGSNTWYNIYSNFKISGTTEVPETYDCLNSFNDISLDKTRTDSSPGWVHLYNLMYQSNGTTIGGEGHNVKYSFTQHDFTISDTGTTYNEDYCYNTDYSNAKVEIDFLGYQRDEIYRFGLVFYDVKGRPSTVKWIGDIRMPMYGDVIGGLDCVPFAWDVNELTHGMSLGITFTINTSTAYSQGARYFKIVRVKREAVDRTILAQGVIPTMMLYGDGSGLSYRGYTIPYTATTTVAGITKYVSPLEFISPEVNFNKNLSYITGDSLELIGRSTVVKQWDNISNTEIPTVGTLPTNSNYSQTLKYSGFDTTLPGSTRSSKIKEIKNFQILPSPTKVVGVLYNDGISMLEVNYKVLNMTECYNSSNNGSSAHFSAGGTKGVIAVNSFGANIGGSSFNCYYCNYKRNVFNSQYGGNTYTSRQFSSYISTGSVQTCLSSGTNTTTVYGGDTYIGMFDYLRNIVHGDIPATRRSHLVMYFPVETSINLRYRMDDCFSKITDDANHSRTFMQELAGDYTSGGLSYTQLIDLYKYNSVYSQENNIVKYFPKSSVIVSGDKLHDNRVLVSDLKIDGELFDNWTMFKADNFLDVDSKYGEITSLLSRDNYLYFWQPKAFGVLSVNQRSVLSDNNPGALVLGTGGVLDRYDYISTNYGASCRFSPVVGLRGLYWMDNINKAICRYNGQSVEPISKTKGINSFIINSIDLNTETISCVDRKYSEVLFTVPYTYTTTSGNSMQPGTYLATATNIPPITEEWRPQWVTTTTPFSTIKTFRMVVEVVEVSGNENYWSDVYIESLHTGTGSSTLKYLRTGTNVFDFVDIGLQDRIAFGLRNAGPGGIPVPPYWTNPHPYKLLFDSINCYEITEAQTADEEFSYSDGDLEVVTSGLWDAQNLLDFDPIIYPITWEAIITSGKMHIETFAPIETQYYSVRAVWPNAIPVGTTNVRVEITISEVVRQMPALIGSTTAITFTDNTQITLAPFSVGTFTFANYGSPDYTLYIDPSKSYDIIFMLQDMSSVPSAMSMTIDKIVIYSAQPSPTPFFTETFDSFYTIPVIGDVPTGWWLYYGTDFGLTATGYHAGGLSVSTVAPVVYNELLDSFNGMYTFNTDTISLFIVPDNTNYITNSRWDLYMHNLGERNTFYGTKYPSTLKFVINDNFEEVKTFDSLKFNSTCKTQVDNIDQYDKTFAIIRCYNDYQNSTFQTIYTSGTNANITRKEREFVLNIPRNRVNLSQPNYPNIFDPANFDETRLFKERMRDKYLITELLYNDTGNNRFNVPYITTDYRISKR